LRQSKKAMAGVKGCAHGGGWHAVPADREKTRVAQGGVDLPGGSPGAVGAEVDQWDGHGWLIRESQIK